MAGTFPLPAPPVAPPRYGLVNAAIDITPADAHWEGGFAFDPESCSASGTVDICAAHTKPIDSPGDVIEFTPFGVWAGDECSPFALGRDWKGRAQRQLAACESKQMEAEFWTGSIAIAGGHPNAYLASNDANTITTSAMAPAAALACLEQGLAECGCGGRGMIHAMPQLVSTWAAANLLRREGSQILTFLDTIVVPGSGYDGSSPDGNPPVSSQWAYATSLVYILRGKVATIPDAMSEAVNRTSNLVEYRAERAAAAVSDGCCHVAAEIDLAPCPDLAAS